MEKNWVSVFTTNSEYIAEIAKGILNENEIDAVVLNKKDSSYTFGEIELFVNRDNSIRAKYLLKELDS